MNYYAIPGISSGIKSKLKIDNVLTRAADYFCIEAALILSNQRRRPIADARFLVMDILRKEGYTLKVIGDVFRRDHTSVMHAIKTVRNLSEPHAVYKKNVTDFKKYLDFNN